MAPGLDAGKWQPKAVPAVFVRHYRRRIAHHYLLGNERLHDRRLGRRGRTAYGTTQRIFFASVTFVRKITQGLGAAFAGLILTVSQFSAGATPGEVPNEVLRDFALVYAPTRLTVWMLMVFCLSMYAVDRTKRKENLKALGRI